MAIVNTEQAVTLELTEKEAQAIVAVFGAMGTCDVFDEEIWDIFESLIEAGIGATEGLQIESNVYGIGSLKRREEE